MISVYSQYAWLIPLFPLLAYVLITASGRSARKTGLYLSTAAIFVSFVVALLIFIERIGKGVQDYTWDGFRWLRIGDLSVSLGFEVNNLNAIMLIIVTLVSLLVHIYSIGYMKEDERVHVFFSYISLFSFAMLGLVISVNLVEFYLFWELVGVCSFLLIGFWYTKPEAKAAAKKAFIVTRIGDFGLFIGILLLFWSMPGHALDFNSVQNAFTSGQVDSSAATWIALLFFMGAMGKSGQFPLHTWLPDAMEGPTPISALIHAATMVAAGVYLVARTFDVFLASDTAMQVVAYVGGFTAIFAATIGTAQNDIKRILAYSTVSQLGYMMMALGVSATYTAGMFHLFTHAFFKALLFLGAGSVIHAVHTQDITKMGGVGGKMKITAWTFAIGTLALSGIPPFSGFWSKDAILSQAYETNSLLFWVGIAGAFFTALYMARLFFLVFWGKSRSGQEAHESPTSMTVPLLLLAVPAALAGFLYTPWSGWFGDWLTGRTEEPAVHAGVMVLSTAAGVLGLVLGYLLYARKPESSLFSAKFPWLYNLVRRKYYIDEIYRTVIVLPLRGIGYLLQAVDTFIVGGAVRLATAAAVGLGRTGSRLQNGQVQTYGLITLLGLLVLILAIAGRRFIHVG
ncbi:NADH-quinone oxidoreductase subunit L [Paenibacillus sp. UNC499MF]|uniref:NADH-quinone oxidoreductase subunit L n=1 Tax=Paenibacillus sp. UNC499MF TaxID=1502751 RepID=UPI00089FE966|nr:NADH-quinone oxidoreductase subunit L [Paenibacillus sp. UNC499MF]SEG62268.1 NADH-quinone oxidoreductase subunit L [Paenibacillus sp. UNC499MF]